MPQHAQATRVKKEEIARKAMHNQYVMMGALLAMPTCSMQKQMKGAATIRKSTPMTMRRWSFPMEPIVDIMKGLDDLNEELKIFSLATAKYTFRKVPKTEIGFRFSIFELFGKHSWKRTYGD